MKAPTLKEFFRHLPEKLDSDAAEGLEAVYQFDLSGIEGGQYFLTVSQGVCRVDEGTHDDPHVTLAMAGEDCIKVLTGQLSGQMAAMSGKLRIMGDLGLALQLRALFPGVGS
ncbi:MAG TPA: SCP2 sterol-binding domain-containing protein [Nitrospira sp.]|nr:SCP2 sterol-binding domain-containing protein [Nitrospira sp.]